MDSIKLVAPKLQLPDRMLHYQSAMFLTAGVNPCNPCIAAFSSSPVMNSDDKLSG